MFAAKCNAIRAPTDRSWAAVLLARACHAYNATFTYFGTAMPQNRSTAAARSHPAAPRSNAAPRGKAPAVEIRTVRRRDLDEVVAIDARVTGVEKRAYWESIHRRYGRDDARGGQFLVAASGARVIGFIIGEIRDWEFGSPPCGWVFAIDVAPNARLAGVGARLLEAICEGFRREGVRTVRTMLAPDDQLVMSFFRSQGMMAGCFIPLEMSLEP